MPNKYTELNISYVTYESYKLNTYMLGTHFPDNKTLSSYINRGEMNDKNNLNGHKNIFWVKGLHFYIIFINNIGYL